jgi:hypothetical protein
VSFSLAPGWLPWILIAIPICAALAVWAYRFGVPPIHLSTRRLLGALRAAALLALVLLIGRPVLARLERSGASQIVVLVDRSLSMTLPVGEGAATREQVAERVAADLARRLGGRHRVVRYDFAAAAYPATGDSARTLDRSGSALGDALAEVGRLPDLAGVVIVSDGVANRGRDPVQAARELGKPVSAVPIGGASGFDAAVDEVAVNPTARAGRATPIAVRLRHGGGTARRGRLTVREGARILAEREVVLGAAGEETVEEMSIVPRGLGLATYLVRLDAGPGELTAANNERAAVQTVLPDRQRALVVTRAPGWETTWLRRALDADSAWAVQYARIDGPGPSPMPGARAAEVPQAADWARATVAIAHGLTRADARGPIGALLLTHLRAGRGLVVWGGEGAGGASLAALGGTPLGAALGIGDIGGAGAELRPALPPGELHEIVRLELDESFLRGVFAALPPLSGVSAIEERAGDRVLVRGVERPVPLLVLRRSGRAQALLVNGSGLWRWGFTAGDGGAAARYQRLWGNALRLLAEPTQAEPLRVAAERPLFAQGEPVGVSASLVDDAFQPVDGAALVARLEAVSGLGGGTAPRVSSSPLRLTAEGGGSYRGAWPALPPGRYRIRAEVRLRGGSARTASGEFVVESASPEFRNVLPDRATLARIAQVSGGDVGDARRAGEFAERVSERAASAGRVRESRLWENPFAFAFVAALLSGEWFLRRRRGLP